MPTWKPYGLLTQDLGPGTLGADSKFHMRIQGGASKHQKNAVLLACCEALVRALMMAYKVLLAFLKVWLICSLYDCELRTNTPRYVNVSVDASAIFP